MPVPAPSSVEHLFDLDMHKGQPGTAKLRADAERCVAKHIITALMSASTVDAVSGPSSTTDSMTITSSAQSASSAQQLPSTPFRPASSAEQQAPVNDDQCVQEPLHPDEADACFPTDQKLQQRERAKARQAQGLEPQPSQKRKKVVEQHFDDCGEDLSSLTGTTSSNLLVESLLTSDDEPMSESDFSASAVANAYAQWALPSMLAEGQPRLHKNSMLAVDIEEMFAILNEPGHRGYGVEIVEICGGNALTSYLCVRRKLHSGHCFELITGTDLTDPEVESKVLAYLM